MGIEKKGIVRVIVNIRVSFEKKKDEEVIIFSIYCKLLVFFIFFVYRDGFC